MSIYHSKIIKIYGLVIYLALAGCHTGAKYEFDRSLLRSAEFDVRSNDKLDSIYLNKENITISADIYRINYMLNLNLKITSFQSDLLKFEYDKIQAITSDTKQVIPIDDVKMVSRGNAFQKNETKEFSYRFDLGKVMDSPHFKKNGNIEQLILLINGLSRGDESIPVKIPIKMVIDTAK